LMLKFIDATAGVGPVVAGHGREHIGLMSL
jgi:hypothetical protein